MERATKFDNPSNLISVLLEYAKLIVAIILLTTLFSILYSFLAPVEYESKVTVVANHEESTSGSNSLSGALGGLTGLSGFDMGSNDAKINIAMAKMNSRIFINNLLIESNLLRFLFPDQWNEYKGTWRDKKPSPEQIYREAKKKYFVSKNKVTGIITITAIHSNPEFTKELANGIVSRINAEMRREEIDESEERVRYLKQELNETSLVNIQNVFYALIEQETQKGMLANTKKDFILKIIDPAIKPESRSKPRRSRIVIFGFIIGVFLGIMASLLLNFYNEEKDLMSVQE